MTNQLESKKHNKKQNIISVIILVVGIFLSSIIFGGKNSKEANKQEEVALKEKQLVKIVKTIKLQENNQSKAQLEKTIFLSSGSKAKVVAEFSGRVEEVNFNVGDYVREGQILVSSEQKNNSARIAYESAQKSFALAQKNLEETKKIGQSSIELADKAKDIAEINLDQAKDEEAEELAEKNLKIAKEQEDQAEASAAAQINGAKIQLEQAQAGLSQARLIYDKNFIKAPIEGKIVSKNIFDNDYINSGQTVAEIVGEGKLEAVAYLNNQEISRVKIGDLVKIEIDKNQWQGKVISLSDVANEDNQRFEIRIEIDNTLLTNLGANQNAKAILDLRIAQENSFFIPLDAVNIGQTETAVFIIQDKLAKKVVVETGEIIGNQIEVIKGLQAGEELIVEGNRNLRDGILVKAVND